MCIRDSRQAVCHITGQIAAVSTGIGAELLFIQALQIVQGLLGCKSKQAVGISLQSSQVIEGGRLFGLFLALHLFDRDGCTLADFFQLLGSGLIDVYKRQAIEEAMESINSVLMTVPGIGAVNAACILGEIGDIKRFSKPYFLHLRYICLIYFHCIV